MIFSRLLQDGRIFGFLNESERDNVKNEFDHLEIGTVTNLLHSVKYLYKGAGSERKKTPVLQDKEEVFATCFEENYYTFATGHSSAYRMYDDKDNIRLLRELIASDPNDIRVSDLTIIRGRVLYFSDNTLGCAGSKNKSLRACPEDSLARSRDMIMCFFDKILDLVQDVETVSGVRDSIVEMAPGAIKPLR
jgi:hypothetical protein